MVFKNIVCPVCGASCDDIQVSIGDDYVEVKNACKMGSAKFREIKSSHRILSPLVRENGSLKEADWEVALDRAAEILVEARRPLLFMGSETACEAQEVGLHMGEFLGGVVDSNSTFCHGPTCMGIQESGRVGATSGQGKQRSDLVIYWGTNPLESMPRHMARY
ncbi:MAG: molybdopterin-dependent oxidoreductase, partial [Methermicoccaceae archaeon]